jgi:hypothetical protein
MREAISYLTMTMTMIITVLGDGNDDLSVCSDDQIFALYLDFTLPIRHAMPLYHT